MARPVVRLEIKPPLPLSPKIVAEAPPPKAPANPSLLSGCKRTITIRAKHTAMCMR